MGLPKGLNVLGADADLTLATADAAKGAVVEPCVNRLAADAQLLCRLLYSEGGHGTASHSP